MVDVILAIIWIAILVLYIVVGWKDAKSNNEVKKEITQMNELLLEQNSQLKEQNKHLNMVILSVCSKSVRDRKDQEEKREKATERTRLKRKRLKAAYNTILEENRRLKGWQSVYGRKEIRTFGERKILTIFEAGSDNMGEIIKDRMAVEIGRALKENGAIQFETYDDPMKCGIIVDAKVKIVMP